MPFDTVSTRTFARFASVVAVGVAAAGITRASAARACPFCSATQQTLGEELASTDAAVLARLVKAPPPYDPTKDNGASYRSLDPEMTNATFEIVEKLRGGEHLIGTETIEVPFFGQPDKDKLFLITGIRTDRVDWTTPLPLSKPAEGYIRKLLGLPKDGPERLMFFQDYLEHEDPMLAQDAYDEFARAPYDLLVGLKDQMHHDRLVEWIHEVELPPSRRQLYLTMLGVCGTEGDLPMLEYYMASTAPHYKAAADAALAAGLAISPGAFQPLLYDAAERHDRFKRTGLDALIACYLTLKGAEGLPLVEELFLKDPNGEYKDTFSAIAAIRFHGDQTDIIPRQRLAESLRIVLDNATFADLVVPDLSRWEDWGVMDRLAQMFQEAEKTSYVRLPIATYMLIAAEQEGDVGEQAASHLEEFRQVDSQTVDDAERNLGFGLFPKALPRKTDDAPTKLESTAKPEATTTVEAEASKSSAAAEPAAGTLDTANDTVVALASSAGDPEAGSSAPPAREDEPVRSETTDAPSGAIADTETQPGDAADNPAQRGAIDTRRAAAGLDDEEDAISPPSTSVIVGGTVVAVVVLAGLFTVLLRGFGR